MPSRCSADRKSCGLGISTPWTKLLKASLVTDNGLTFDPYVRGIFDDGLFALHVFEHAKKTAYIRDQVYHYRILPGSIIHRFHPDRLATDRRVFEKILEFAEKNNKGEAFRKAYEAKVVQFWVRSFAVYFFHRDYPGNSRQNYREFISTAKSEPYREAIRAVDPGILKKIQRYCVGDIVVGQGSTNVFVLDSVAQLVADEVTKIGRVGVRAELFCDDSITVQVRTQEINGTVASLRADSILSLALHISREKASALIKNKGISIDHITTFKTDTLISEHQTFSVTGCGKFVLESINGVSKKDRIHVTLCKFI